MFILYTLRLPHTLHLLAEKRIKKKINHHQDRIKPEGKKILYLYLLIQHFSEHTEQNISSA